MSLGVLDVLYRRRAGRSAARRYKTLSRAWRQRVFGRRFGLYFWTIVFLLFVLLATVRLSSPWSLVAGSLLGGVVVMWLVMPDALMPSAIYRWQIGAWGEEMTASELKALKGKGWTVVHDVRWGNGNHDHVVAGPCVWVLNTKNLKESEITLENGALRVTQIDTQDSYLADGWVPLLEREANSLKRELGRQLGFPVHVYPVIVLWGSFAAREDYIGDVGIVHGDRLAAWLQARPRDLLTDEKRTAVASAVSRLPRAGR